jgi:glucokinase
MNRSRAVIGIDIGGSKTLFALFDDSFRVVEKLRIQTPLDKGEKGFTRALAEGASELARRAKKRDLALLGVGVGCAGVIDRAAGVLRFSPNIPFLRNYRLSATLVEATGVDAFVDNDVHMGLYGEHQLGAAKGLKHVIGVFFGTGVGAAVIVDGKLHLGASGAAGEIGHYLISAMGALSGWERHGILDDFVSRNAMAGEAAALAAKQWAPRLFELAGADAGKIHGATLAKAIELGDKRVEYMVRGRARMAGIALSNIVDFLNPQMVVLGGGLADAMPALFLKEVGEGIRRNTIPEVRGSLKIAVSRLRDLAVAAGAAKMAWERLREEAPPRGDQRRAFSSASARARLRRAATSSGSSRTLTRRIAAPPSRSPVWASKAPRLDRALRHTGWVSTDSRRRRSSPGAPPPRSSKEAKRS